MEIVFPLKHQSVQSRKAWINGRTNDNDDHDYDYDYDYDFQHIWRIKRKGQRAKFPHYNK